MKKMEKSLQHLTVNFLPSEPFSNEEKQIENYLQIRSQLENVCYDETISFICSLQVYFGSYI